MDRPRAPSELTAPRLLLPAGGSSLDGDTPAGSLPSARRGRPPTNRTEVNACPKTNPLSEHERDALATAVVHARFGQGIVAAQKDVPAYDGLVTRRYVVAIPDVDNGYVLTPEFAAAVGISERAAARDN